MTAITESKQVAGIKTKIENLGAKRLEKKSTRSLRCELTKEELLECGKELADAKQQIDILDGELQQVKEQYKSRRTALEGKLNYAAQVIATGHEIRKVDCLTTHNYDNGRVTIVRLDTDELIEDRAMNEDERQRKLEI
jgi:transposase